MEAYSIVEAGGRQYMVRPGDVIQVNRLSTKAGGKVTMKPVIAVSDGKKLSVGTPEIKGAKVNAVVVDHIRGPKVVAFKKKRRKGYKRKVGHRQDLTVLRIDSISGK